MLSTVDTKCITKLYSTKVLLDLAIKNKNVVWLNMPELGLTEKPKLADRGELLDFIESVWFIVEKTTQSHENSFLFHKVAYSYKFAQSHSYSLAQFTFTLVLVRFRGACCFFRLGVRFVDILQKKIIL